MNTHNILSARLLRPVAAAVVAVAVAGGALAGAGTALLTARAPGNAASSPTATAAITSTVSTVGREQAVTAVVAAAVDSVVTIRTDTGSGSGFIVSQDGRIVTSLHVIAGAGSVSAVLGDGTVLPAAVIGTDPQHDVAILDVTGTGFHALSLATGETQIGQTVVALGTALGEFPNTVTVGIVSGLGRSIDVGIGGSARKLKGVLQTDAALNPGMSGGPLLNLAGQVVGVDTAVAGGANGIGFAEPIASAAALLGRAAA